MHCLSCNSNNSSLVIETMDVEYFSTDKKYKYFRCNDCEAMSISPVPINDLSTIYPNNYYSFQDQKDNFVQKIKQYLEIILFKKIIRKINTTGTLKVLDIGGGSGWMLNTISKATTKKIEGTIVDIDDKAKNIAERDGYTYINNTVENFSTGKKYNLILLLNLIEHIADPTATLNKLSEYLEPGGIILIKTPNIDSLDFRIFKNTYWGGLHCPRHWILFNKNSFKKMINRTNLKILELRYTQGAPFWTWSSLHFLHRFKLVTFSRLKPIPYSKLAPIFNIVFAIFDFLRLPFFKTSQFFILLSKE
tara:strand:+ start:3142 stop:4056 length:915 start_codon:yes stop_codon:yes gene_type:complete